ncbi:MAG TPA: hypothetical protein VF516_09580 [Kofleriaceae bacterium]
MSGRLVAPSTAPLTAAPGGDEIYVTSQLFACTTPVRVNLQEPSALVVERFVRELGLPRQVAHGTALGFHISYALARDDQRLSSARSLADQGVGPGQLLWLETDLRPLPGPSRSRAAWAMQRVAASTPMGTPRLAGSCWRRSSAGLTRPGR